VSGFCLSAQRRRGADISIERRRCEDRVTIPGFSTCHCCNGSGRVRAYARRQPRYQGPAVSWAPRTGAHEFSQFLPARRYASAGLCGLATLKLQPMLNQKQQLRHRTFPLRQHAFLVYSVTVSLTHQSATKCTTNIPIVGQLRLKITKI